MNWGSEKKSGREADTGREADAGGAAGTGGPGEAGAAPGSDRLVLLVSLNDPVEAEIVAAKLRSAGIDCFMGREALGVVYGLTIDGLGQRNIMVRAEDLEAARAALEEE